MAEVAQLGAVSETALAELCHSASGSAAQRRHFQRSRSGDGSWPRWKKILWFWRGLDTDIKTAQEQTELSCICSFSSTARSMWTWSTVMAHPLPHPVLPTSGLNWPWEAANTTGAWLSFLLAASSPPGQQPMRDFPCTSNSWSIFGYLVAECSWESSTEY